MISDNPLLTTRLVAGPSPHPIIVDSRLRCPLDRRVLQRKPLIACTEAGLAEETRARALREAGAELLVCKANPMGGVDLADLFSRLCGRFRSVMVEGGAGIISSLLETLPADDGKHEATPNLPCLVDEFVVTIAPVLVGGVRALSRPVPSLPRLTQVQCAVLGHDVVLCARPAAPALETSLSAEVAALRPVTLAS